MMKLLAHLDRRLVPPEGTDARYLRVQLVALDNTGGRIAAAAGRLDVAASTVLNTGGALLAASSLAVTATTRSTLLPAVPTLAETVMPGFEAQGYIGIAGPAGTPAQRFA